MEPGKNQFVIQRKNGTEVIDFQAYFEMYGEIFVVHYSANSNDFLTSHKESGCKIHYKKGCTKARAKIEAMKFLEEVGEVNFRIALEVAMKRLQEAGRKP